MKGGDIDGVDYICLDILYYYLCFGSERNIVELDNPLNRDYISIIDNRKEVIDLPTVKEANAKNKSRAWFIRQLMQKKEAEAKLRLAELTKRQSVLEPIAKQHDELWNRYLKPLLKDVHEYTDNQFEIVRLEKFLQGQREREVEVEKLEYNAPKQKLAKAAVDQFKSLPLAAQEQILKEMGVIK